MAKLMSVLPQINLLWPHGMINQQVDTSFLEADLNLKSLIRALAIHPRYESHIRSILLALTSDIPTIQYRQDIIRDLLENPALFNSLELALEEITTLETYLNAPQWKDNVLRQIAWRLSELQRFVETVVSLHNILQQAGETIQSEGLKELRRNFQAIVSSDLFRRLEDELPRILPQLREVRSITIGINLDPEMRPTTAILLSAHPDYFENQSMFTRLFGKSENSGVGDLHDSRHVAGLGEIQIELKDRNSPFMPPLFRDLSNLMDNTSRPIAKALRQYTEINSQFLLALKNDIAFYLGAVRLIQRIQGAGLPICQPEILPMSERVTHVDDMYNITLCLQHLSRHADASDVVVNAAHFDEDGRIFILTGPNQGGKTTYAQALGLLQIMAQAGLHIPAKTGHISPVDAIFTHFARQERPDLEAGRLGEEARRLNTIFQQATAYSLVLLNESLASTSASESLFLAQEVVSAFRLLGVRAIFATHLHDLAAEADNMNEAVEGTSRIISMVSQVKIEGEGQQIRRTYKIIQSPPMSKSYAIELAARYGISYQQLRDLLKERRQI